MKPFDLQKALAGEKLITRDGREVTEFHYFETTKKINRNIVCVVDGDYQSYYDNGQILTCNESPVDLMMAPTTKTYYVNVFKRTDLNQFYAVVTQNNYIENLAGDKHIKTIEFEITED